jgi:transposase-like protein
MKKEESREMNCPSCISDYVIKNGFSKGGKQKYKCRDCGKQFVLNPQNQISEEKKEMVDRLLLEKISLRGIGRSLGISFSWIKSYVKKKYREVPQQIEVEKKVP